MKKQQYTIYNAEQTAKLFKKRPKGRSVGTNNDHEIVAIALQGLLQGKYKTYTEAMETLHAQSWERGKDYRKAYGQQHTKERLRRAIGRAFFDSYGQSIQRYRKAKKL